MALHKTPARTQFASGRVFVLDLLSLCGSWLKIPHPARLGLATLSLPQKAFGKERVNRWGMQFGEMNPFPGLTCKFSLSNVLPSERIGSGKVVQPEPVLENDETLDSDLLSNPVMVFPVIRATTPLVTGKVAA